MRRWSRQFAPFPMREHVTGAPYRNPAFEYTGSAVLTVDGPVSRNVYRFAYAGARAEVDFRDAPALASIPALKRL